MKKLIAVLAVVAIAVVACISAKGVAAVDKAGGEGMIRHIVLFKFKEGTTPEQVKDIEKRFADLKNQIPQIKDFEWGTNISPENMAQGFTHAFLVTFADEAGRDAYLPSAPHQAFAKSLGPYIDKVLVIDYKARK